MSSYGQVINGGAQMRKGLGKGINDKLEDFAEDKQSRKMLSDSVKRVIFKGQLSEPKLNNVDGKKFTSPKKITNV